MSQTIESIALEDSEKIDAIEVVIDPPELSLGSVNGSQHPILPDVPVSILKSNTNGDVKSIAQRDTPASVNGRSDAVTVADAIAGKPDGSDVSIDYRQMSQNWFYVEMEFLMLLNYFLSFFHRVNIDSLSLRLTKYIHYTLLIFLKQQIPCYEKLRWLDRGKETSQ